VSTQVLTQDNFSEKSVQSFYLILPEHIPVIIVSIVKIDEGEAAVMFNSDPQVIH